ncbi:MAG TPA: glycerol-3-phosphate acyltransferase [Gaiellaceae bacterium]|nr:glycerol-3-phosphate acyltransferase [Gaiellaceae bacterium]
MRTVRLLTAASVGYVLGTVPSADIVARLVAGGRVDLRRSGSGNPGALNVGRVLGQRPGRAVLVADVAKGYAGCAAGRAVAGDLGAHIAGVTAVLGHCYPAWKDFDGGKGLATSFGQCLFTFPVAAPVDLGLAIGVARIPGLRGPGLVSTVAASSAWLLMSLVWWRRRLPNSWGPEPTAALFVANCATVGIVASRFVVAHRRGHPDDLAQDD